MVLRALALGIAVSLSGSGHADELRRGLFHSPAVSKTDIVFVRGNELWRVSRNGGVARTLGVPANFNSLPKFSPDGRTVALLTSFDGAYELGTVSIDGGDLRRVTHYPRNGKGLMQWLPSDRLLYFTESDFRIVESQLYTVAVRGGLPQKLPVPYGAECSISSNGEWLAYTLHLRPNYYWKHYKGGMAGDIWLYNLRTGRSKRVTTWPGYDQRPMWNGRAVYYISDQGADQTMNVWSYDTTSGRRRQLTHARGADIQNPYMSLETDEIAYERSGDIWVLDLRSGVERHVEITIPEESQKVGMRRVETSDWLVSRTLSPNGDWVATEARGDLWVSPNAGGQPRNLTKTDGVFERDPAWSPDGKWIACFSDESGEYQLTLISPENGEKRRITDFKAGFRQTPKWSPDSRWIGFMDDAGRFFVAGVETQEVRQFDKDPLGQVNQLSWSPDSRWIAYTKSEKNSQTAIWAYDTATRSTHQLTSGFVSDSSPVFDASGNYLYYLSVRDYSGRVSQMMDRQAVYATPVALIAVSLRAGGPSPSANSLEPTGSVSIDVDGFEARGVALAVPSGRFASLFAGEAGKLFYLRTNPLQPPVLQTIDLGGDAVQETVLEGVGAFEPSPDRTKLLVFKDGGAYVIPASPAQAVGQPTAAQGYAAEIQPMREWSQISRDVWRLFRDYFYDPNMHGLDWNAQWDRFQPMLRLAASRDDVNYVLGEMISDLSVGHAMMTGPGDVPGQPWKAAGQLGVDFELINGAYRIAKIYRGAPWDPAGRSPLEMPGNEVRVGEFLLALNDKPLDATQDPWAPFIGLANQTVTLTVGPNPAIDASSRKVTVRTLERESDLRLKDWVERNRRHVNQASGGKLGYIYLADVGNAGTVDFARQFYGQLDKQGVVVDARWNSGGNTSDRLIEMLKRPLLNAYTERYTTQSFPIPEKRIPGPKALLINRVTSSSGENFAYYFKKAKLGKVIGTRTWGGLIGVNGNQALIDGGFWWIPQSAFYIDEKIWMPEGRGVTPDIEVMDDPAFMRDGKDPQLDTAVRSLLESLKSGKGDMPNPPIVKLRKRGPDIH